MSVSLNMDSSTIRSNYVHSGSSTMFNNSSDNFLISQEKSDFQTDIIVQDLNEGTELGKWFSFLLKNVTKITPAHIDLVSEIFKFHWFRETDQDVVNLYIELLAHLNSAHSNDYIIQTYESLVRPLRGFNMSDLPLPIDYDDMIDEYVADPNIYHSIHNAIKRILWISPSSAQILSQVITELFPHKVFDIECQKIFLTNILQIVDYCPPIKEHIILLAVDKLLQIDVDVKVDFVAPIGEESQHTIFEVEMNNQEEEAEKNELLEKLDSLLSIFLDYLSNQNVDEIKDTYVSLKKAFDRLILHTHKPKYTQFLLFFFCKRHPDFVNDFLNHLFTTLENESASNLQKINCVLYIGSFVARAKYVQDVTIQRVLFLFIEWMNHYVLEHENGNPNTEVHKLFYHIFQATCYIIVHTHFKIFENVEKTILKDLGLERIVISALNPLKICFAPLVKDFVLIASKYGIKLFHILESNEKIILPTGSTFSEAYFPFDPYFTKQSSQYIKDMYNITSEYKVDSGYQTEEEESGNENNMDEDYEIGGSFASSTMMQMLGSSFPSSGILLGSSVQSSGGAFDEEIFQNKSPFKM